jgi:hypothetical protein
MGADMDETTVEESRMRTPLLLGGVAVAAVVAALLGYFVVVPMFFAAPADETFVAARRAPAATVSPTPAPAATTLKTFRSGALHDPFKPLVAAGGGSGAVSDTGTAAGSTTAGSTTAGSTTGTTTGTATTAPTEVSVIDITTEQGSAAVMVRLDTAIHVATPGQTIAGVLKVVSIKGKSATFLYGDSSFTLRIGQVKVLS